MANDNTLGAPTEGLGQTVTFAAGGGGGVPQTSAGQQPNLRMDLIAQPGKQAPQSQYIPPKPDPTFEVLMKMGSDILAPHIEAERTRKYVDGMQQAAQGQAIADIVEEQPWYSKVFGSTSLVDGARAYTAMAKSQSVATELQAKMPELRRMSGPEFSQYATDQVMAARTGDAATDAMVMQQLSKELPHKMQAQAKEHFVWQQETLLNSNATAVSAAGANLQAIGASARDAGSTADPLDVLTGQISFMSSLEKPNEVDQTLWEGHVAKTVAPMVANGNLAAGYAMVDSGALAKMDPRFADPIQRAIKHAEAQSRVKMPVELAEAVASFKTADRTASTPEDIHAQYEGINVRYAQLTGAREPLLSTHDLSGELASQQRVELQKIAHAQAVAQRANDKANKAALEAQAYQEAVVYTSGKLASGADVYPAKKEKLADAWAHLQANNPEQAMAARVSQLAMGVKDEGYERAYRSNLNKAFIANNPADVERAYQEQFLPLVRLSGNQGVTAAAAYSGDFSRQMTEYHNLRKVMPNTVESWVVAMHEATTKPPPPLTESKRDKALVELASTGTVSKWAQGVWNSNYVPLPNDTAEALVAELAPDIHKHSSLLSDEAAYKSALSNAKMRDLEVSGGTFWRRPDGASTMITALAPEGDAQRRVVPAEVDAALKMTFDKVLTASGLDTSHHKVIQLSDENKDARLMVGGVDKNGQMSWVLVKGEEIKNTWARRNEKAPYPVTVDQPYAPVTANPTYAAAELAAFKARMATKGSKQ